MLLDDADGAQKSAALGSVASGELVLLVVCTLLHSQKPKTGSSQRDALNAGHIAPALLSPMQKCYLETLSAQLGGDFQPRCIGSQCSVHPGQQGLGRRLRAGGDMVQGHQATEAG